MKKVLILLFLVACAYTIYDYKRDKSSSKIAHAKVCEESVDERYIYETRKQIQNRHALETREQKWANEDTQRRFQLLSPRERQEQLVQFSKTDREINWGKVAEDAIKAGIIIFHAFTTGEKKGGGGKMQLYSKRSGQYIPTNGTIYSY